MAAEQTARQSVEAELEGCRAALGRASGAVAEADRLREAAEAAGSLEARLREANEKVEELTQRAAEGQRRHSDACERAEARGKELRRSSAAHTAAIEQLREEMQAKLDEQTGARRAAEKAQEASAAELSAAQREAAARTMLLAKAEEAQHDAVRRHHEDKRAAARRDEERDAVAAQAAARAEEEKRARKLAQRERDEALLETACQRDRAADLERQLASAEKAGKQAAQASAEKADVERLEHTLVKLTALCRSKDQEIKKMKAIVQKECLERTKMLAEISALRSQLGSGVSGGGAAGGGAVAAHALMSRSQSHFA